jgi:hypothetical protein
MDKSSKSATIGPNLMERIKQSAMAVETGENRRFAQQGKWVSLDRYWKPLKSGIGTGADRPTRISLA